MLFDLLEAYGRVRYRERRAFLSGDVEKIPLLFRARRFSRDSEHEEKARARVGVTSSRGRTACCRG